MPFLQEQPRFKGITLPPKGWVLAFLLSVYIFVGLIGHDPWKSDDAISIGIAYSIVMEGNWLLLTLAGQPHPDLPLYYWAAAITAHLFSWLLPLHDAARLASGFFTLLALQFILLASRELHGRDHAAAAPLLLAGSVGFLFHAHEAQPMLAALAAHAAAYWALALLPRRPVTAWFTLGIAIATTFLANGLIPLIILLPIIFIAWCLSKNKAKEAVMLLLSLLLALAVISLWWLPLKDAHPEYLSALLLNELSSLTQPINSLSNGLDYLTILPWYAWPAFPLAVWFVWAKRRLLLERPLALPLFSFLLTLAILSWRIDARSVTVLLLLPPLVLQAAPCVAILRRGAANAFDWFSMATFSLAAIFVWIGWCALVFGWPERFAQQAVQFAPGFVGHFSLAAFLASVLISCAWLWFVITTPRSPLRGIMSWMAGLTLFWFLVAILWMPWIDYSKTYRSVSASLSKALEARTDCIANANTANGILASLDYFDSVRTLPLRTEEGARCNWLLIQGAAPEPKEMTAAGWRKRWEGKRPGDRGERDWLHLYQRDTRRRRVAPLPEIEENPDHTHF